MNLTAATQVIHYDRWWNPAVEDQASDRAHRIGQTERVLIHRLVAVGTLEERIDALLEAKREVASAVVGAGETWITELERDALLDLVALSDATRSPAPAVAHAASDPRGGGDR
jgi:SNF2 family DNA or RNA helicase